MTTDEDDPNRCPYCREWFVVTILNRQHQGKCHLKPQEDQ